MHPCEICCELQNLMLLCVQISLTATPLRYRTSVYEDWARTQETSSVPLLANAVAKRTQEDLQTIYRISQLTGVIMDEKVATLHGAETDNLRKIAMPDRREARWARRTLHK